MPDKFTCQCTALLIWFKLRKITRNANVPMSWIEDNKLDNDLKQIIHHNSFLSGFVLTLWWEIDWICRFEENAYSWLADDSIERLFREIIAGTRSIYSQRARRKRGDHNYDGECDYCGQFSFLQECKECTGLLCVSCMDTHTCNRDIMAIAPKDLTQEGEEKYKFLMKKLGKKGCPFYQISSIICSLENEKIKVFIHNKPILPLVMPELIQLLKTYNLSNDEVIFLFS